MGARARGGVPTPRCAAQSTACHPHGIDPAQRPGSPASAAFPSTVHPNPRILGTDGAVARCNALAQ